jgi:8-oxo-dGTP diphosphatase
LLVLRCRDTPDEQFDEYLVLPGGGQEPGETLEQALRRECKEEINVEVEVKDLVFIREYIGKNHEFATHQDAHQIDFFFRCIIREGQPMTGQMPDSDQLGVTWIALTELENTNFYPRAMRPIRSAELRSERISHAPVYLGDIN